jgi:hypothetical protein
MDFDNTPGCTNHGCPLHPPYAVGTNGGCKCLRELTPVNRMAVYSMRKCIKETSYRRLNQLEEENRQLWDFIRDLRYMG